MARAWHRHCTGIAQAWQRHGTGVAQAWHRHSIIDFLRFWYIKRHFWTHFKHQTSIVTDSIQVIRPDRVKQHDSVHLNNSKLIQHQLKQHEIVQNGEEDTDSRILTPYDSLPICFTECRKQRLREVGEITTFEIVFFLYFVGWKISKLSQKAVFRW